MKRRWNYLGIAILVIALLGLWIEARPKTECINCKGSERPFFQVFSMLSKDPEARSKKFASLASQTYPHFRVAISADEANFPDVKKFIELHPERFVRLPDGYESQELVYRWIHSVPEDDIITFFPANGSLDSMALEHLKDFYVGSAAWLAFQGDVKRWASDGLLTGYANLFQKIKLQEFLDEGTFSEKCTPENRLFELAGRHARRMRGTFIDGKNYGYSWIARSKKPYPRFSPGEKSPEKKVDLVIFSYDRPLQLFALLESVDKFVTHLDHISVVYRVSSPSYEQGYDIVKKQFPKVEYLKQGERPELDFKPLVLKACFDSDNPYIMFAVDDMIVRGSMDLTAGIEQMEKTGAFGVYYRLGRHINFSYMLGTQQPVPHSVELEENVYAWQFAKGVGDWNYPHTVDMTLYRKSDIRDNFKSLDYRNPNTLESKWALKRKVGGIGIYYETSKVVNIPLNLVNLSTNKHTALYTTEELLAKFLQGLKLDIKPLEGYRNNSAHIDVPVSFVAQHETKI